MIEPYAIPIIKKQKEWSFLGFIYLYRDKYTTLSKGLMREKLKEYNLDLNYL